MPDPTDILPGNVPPRVDPEPSGRLRCEFCECQLTPRGEVLKMSEKSRTIRDHDIELAKRDRKIAELEAVIEENKRKIAELTPAQRAAFDLHL